MVTLKIVHKGNVGKNVELREIDELLRSVGYTIHGFEMPGSSDLGKVSYNRNNGTTGKVYVSLSVATPAYHSYCLSLLMENKEEQRILKAMDKKGLSLLGKKLGKK